MNEPPEPPEPSEPSEGPTFRLERSADAEELAAEATAGAERKAQEGGIRNQPPQMAALMAAGRPESQVNPVAAVGTRRL